MLIQYYHWTPGVVYAETDTIDDISIPSGLLGVTQMNNIGYKLNYT
jgi:hypothetical protein